MNRIDFHSIATILLGGLIDADYSQMDFIYMLFGSFANNNIEQVSPCVHTTGKTCWGLATPSPSCI